MEEKWIKVQEIQRVSNLVKDKRIINLVQKEWKKIQKLYKFDMIKKMNI